MELLLFIGIAAIVVVAVRSMTEPTGLRFSDKELSELFHLLDDRISAHGVAIAHSSIKPLRPQIPVPWVRDALHPTDGTVPIGILDAGAENEQVIGPRNAELDKHALIVGRTGTGKSVLAQAMVHGIAADGYPVVLLDPHGSLADDVIDTISTYLPERVDDVVVIDLGDADFPPAINPLDIRSADQVEVAVDQVMSLLASHSFEESTQTRAAPLAQRAASAMASANLALSPANKLTLGHIGQFFTDPEFRRIVVECGDGADVREAFDPDHGSYEVADERKKLEFAAPVLNALQRVQKSQTFRRSFATTNKLDWSNLIGANSIVICKMARHGGSPGDKKLGELVAGMLLTSLLGTMNSWGRRRDPESGEMVGRGCRIFVDESPAVVQGIEAVLDILAEARKWDLGLILLAQFPAQFRDPAFRSAIFGNTGTKISLALDANTVGGMAKAINGASTLINDSDIAGLPNFAGYGNLLVPAGGDQVAGTGPFAFSTLPPPPIPKDAELDRNRSRIQDQSRATIAVSRELVDQRLDSSVFVEGPIEELISQIGRRDVTYDRPIDQDLALDSENDAGPHFWDSINDQK